MAEGSSVDTIKQAISREMRDLRPRLIEISHTIHATPELQFQEHQAAALLTGELEREGFTVERGVAGIDEAVTALLLQILVPNEVVVEDLHVEAALAALGHRGADPPHS
ncbi:MAG: hypothetical protein M1337_00815, partial [Actinobacteria bacterium]|nr:hypothetical protein [Actinomycetota bacterium]